MNLLKQFWNWLVQKTSTAPQLTIAEEAVTPVEVEEEHKPSDIAEMFNWVCRECGVKPKWVEEQLESFEGSYTGSADEDSIRSAMRKMCQENEVMAHFFKNRNL